MAVLDLNAAKDDLRIFDEDARVQSLLDAAISSAANFINRAIPWKDDAGVPVEVPEDVNAAIRLELRALCYEPKDVQSSAFKALLIPYRVY